MKENLEFCMLEMLVISKGPRDPTEEFIGVLVNAHRNPSFGISGMPGLSSIPRLESLLH